MTGERIDKVEKAIGVKLYDWQRDYIAGVEYDKDAANKHKAELVKAHILRLILTEKEISKTQMYELADSLNYDGIRNFDRWCWGETQEYHGTLKEAGVRVCKLINT